MNPPIQHSSIPHTRSPLRCPVCQNSLTREDRTHRCEKGHSFDLAKEGYINLLLSHQRKSKNPGDDKAMIQARRRFFDSGAYNPLTELIQHSTSHIPHPTILDCGCGEGHMLGTLSEKQAGQFFGVDVSKEAIRCAAKRYKEATWIVANGMRSLPFADDSLDLILSVLAPRNVEEFARIVKPDGALLIGVPGPNHLIELRSLLTENAGDFEEKANEAAEKCAPLFKEKNREFLSYETPLDKTQIADLIQMTPIFWTATAEAKEKVMNLDGIELTVSFVLLFFGVRQ